MSEQNTAPRVRHSVAYSGGAFASKAEVIDVLEQASEGRLGQRQLLEAAARLRDTPSCTWPDGLGGDE